jgi:hypothetical protein
MKHNEDTGFISIVDTGHGETTAGTSIWTAEASRGKIGTWRTSDRGRTHKGRQQRAPTRADADLSTG